MSGWSFPVKAGREVRVVGVQPQWRVEDYRSGAAFRAWLRGQLELAREHLAPDRPNLVVLTELNGLPLLLRGARMAARAKSLNGALALTLVKYLPGALYLAARERVSLPRALQLALAADVAEEYLSACRELAREYGVYLCCGTAPLPHFARRGRHLMARGGAVFNEAVMLDPQGELVGLTDKVYLTGPEGPQGLDFAPGRLEDLRVFPTLVGDLAVATSLDAFKPDVVGHFDALGATVLLQPDANGSPWTGLEQEAPGERDQPVAWLESAWRAVQGARSIRYAVNPMVVGNLFDVAFDGQSAITARPEEAPTPRSYVMTEPRSGFLALLPWVANGSREDLRRVGRELAPHSGSPLENRYRVGVVVADLYLPPLEREPESLRPFEQAVGDFLAGHARFRTDPAVRALNAAWPLVGPALAVQGARLLQGAKRRRGLAVLLAGVALTVLTR